MKFEASGGVTLKNVRQIAATGVDFISVGALTHSARAIDMSLELTHVGQLIAATGWSPMTCGRAWANAVVGNRTRRGGGNGFH